MCVVPVLFYLTCGMYICTRMWLSVRMYVRTPVCVFVPYYRNLNTPLFLADMAPFLVYRMYDVYRNVRCVSFLVHRNSVFRFMWFIRSRYRFFDIWCLVVLYQSLARVSS